MDAEKLTRSIEAVSAKVSSLRDEIRELREVIAAQSTLAVSWSESTYFPPVSGWAMDVRLLAEVNRIASALQAGANVVELGSGASTLWLARMLRGRGVNLTSYEHDESYLQDTRRLLEQFKLAGEVNLIHAPLVKEHGFGTSTPWYRLGQLCMTVDLLVVDGPPGQQDYASRLPSVEAFASRMALGGIVIVDDATRANDRRVLDAWLNWRYGASYFSQIRFVGGGAILRREGEACDVE